MKTIEIRVDAKGEVVVETRGFAGPSCKETSRFIEQALGERTGEQLTAEFYQPQAARQQAQTGQ